MSNIFPNPLNIHDLRQLHHCPPHFTKVAFSCPTQQAYTRGWIMQNLSGRFYFGEVDTPTATGYTRQCLVGFELGCEASYFSIMLNKIQQNIS